MLIDFADIFRRLGKGAAQIVGLALLGLVMASIIYLVDSRYVSTTAATRVSFSFPGSGKGLYPDNSKFAPEDLIAPDVVSQAIKHSQFELSSASQDRIRSALSVEAIIPDDVTKLRDRMIAAGQSPPPYAPDEFILRLTLPRTFRLNNEERAILLNSVISEFKDKFRRTYAAIPEAFGNMQETLSHTDFDDYERILGIEAQSIDAYLSQLAVSAGTYRSPTTNLSFTDLLKESQLFSQIYLNETLGLIRLSSLSRDRKTALLKMDYELQTLRDKQDQALGEEKTTQDMLTQAENHAGNYVLGIKSQAAQAPAGAPLLDQGLVDSLLANDTYNFLMHKALEASLKVQALQAETTRITDRRRQMDAALHSNTGDDSVLVKKTLKSMEALESAYQRLITDIRNTYADYSRQQFSDAIRLSAGITNDSGLLRPLTRAGVVGLVLGGALGLGLSLLEIFIGERRRPFGAT